MTEFVIAALTILTWELSKKGFDSGIRFLGRRLRAANVEVVPASTEAAPKGTNDILDN